MVLAVDLGESEQLVRDYMNRVELTFPALLDRDDVVGALYGVRATPTRFIIDRRGNVVAMGIGPQDWFSQEARILIKTLLETEIASGPGP